MSEPIEPRPRPCASCPYRRNVPSGVWDETEYRKLERYDGDTMSQYPAVFMCHQQDGHACSGWLGHREPYELLAVRLGVISGTLSEACVGYMTDIPLFSSGAEAAAHGAAGIADPDEAARDTIGKIVSRRGIRS